MVPATWVPWKLSSEQVPLVTMPRAVLAVAHAFVLSSRSTWVRSMPVSRMPTRVPPAVVRRMHFAFPTHHGSVMTALDDLGL